MHSPKVSVIMPAYNAAGYIKEAIKSVLNQTFADWELLIIDDGSTDETKNIAEEFARADDRIKIFSQKNSGVSAARNVGLKMAKGTYIAWQDADDISYADRLQLQAKFLDANPGVGMVGGNLEFFDEHGPRSVRKYATDDKSLRKNIFKFQAVAQPAAMVRKICFDELGGFNESLAAAEDMDMTFRIGTKYKFANIPHVLIRYRQNKGSLTFKKFRDLEQSLLLVRKKYQSHPAYHYNSNDAVYNLAQKFSSHFISPSLKIRLFNLLRNSPPSRIVFVCHSHFLPGNKIFDSHWPSTFEPLNHYFGSSYGVLRHSLYRGGESRWYKKGISGSYIRVPLLGKLPNVLRYVFEVGFNFFFFLLTSLKSPVLVFAADPLSAFAPCLLKLLGLPVHVIFLTLDFTKRRFQNSLLNRIYFWIDKFCTIHADKNYCSADTVIEYKKQLYGSAVSSHLVHYPNTPAPWITAKYKKLTKVPFRVVYAGTISNNLNFPAIFRAIQKLSVQFPSLHARVLGDGDQREFLENLIKTEQLTSIQMLGLLPFDETQKEVAEGEVGLALYAGNLDYDEFRDSVKIREYQSLGTIPLATRTVKANAEEIIKYESGVLTENTAEAIESALTKILSDPEAKQKLRENCLKNHEIYKDKFIGWFKALQRMRGY